MHISLHVYAVNSLAALNSNVSRFYDWVSCQFDRVRINTFSIQTIFLPYFRHLYPLISPCVRRSRRNDVDDLLRIPLRKQPIRQLVRLAHLSFANRPHPEEAAHELAVRVSRNGCLQLFDGPVGDSDVFARFRLEGFEDLVVGLSRGDYTKNEKGYVSLKKSHEDEGEE